MPRPVPSAAAPFGGAKPTLDRRALAFALSAAIHAAALAALLLWQFAPSAEALRTALTVVDLSDHQPEEQKPLPPPKPVPGQGAAPARAAGAPAPKAEAAPLAAAIPVTIPSFAPAPIPAQGNAPSSGAALAGAGTGAGGAGSGSGGGGKGGSGSGSGGNAGEGTEPRIVRGDFKPSDYPKSLREAGPRGRTWTEVTVGTNGRPLACRIERSSGTALLDSETCRIIMQRFRFRPGKDAAGKVVQAPFFIDIGWEYVDLNAD